MDGVGHVLDVQGRTVETVSFVEIRRHLVDQEKGLCRAKLYKCYNRYTVTNYMYIGSLQ